MSSAAVPVARLTAFSRSLASMKKKVLMLWSVLVVSGSDDVSGTKDGISTNWNPIAGRSGLARNLSAVARPQTTA
jgi:hypothetical protein